MSSSLELNKLKITTQMLSKGLRLIQPGNNNNFHFLNSKLKKLMRGRKRVSEEAGYFSRFSARLKSGVSDMKSMVSDKYRFFTLWSMC